MKEYLFAILAIVIVGLACFPVSEAIGYQTVGLIFLMVVAGLSLFLGRGPVVFSAFLNFIVWNFFFIPPLFTFQVHNLHDLITLFANLLIAIVGGTLIHRIRKNQLQLQKNQEDIKVLYSLLKAMNNASSIKEVVLEARSELLKHFEADLAIWLKEIDGDKLSKRVFGNEAIVDSEEFEIAAQVFDQNIISGKFTMYHETAKLQYIPLVVPRGVIGVAGVQFTISHPDDENYQLLKSFITQIALSLEREINIDLVKRTLIHVESEKLFQTILNSVSHELRTPIAIITTAVSNLDQESILSNPQSRRQICDELNIASQRLNFLVENILDMSRIESGHLKPNFQYWDIHDLIGTMMNELNADWKGHKVVTEVSDQVSMIFCDIKLLKQSLLNVVHNSIIYSSPGTKIVIKSFVKNSGEMVIQVLDQGPGVPDESLKLLFDKFYRLPGSKSGGTGLGLTITKAIIEAHHGKIQATNRVNGGLSVEIVLPNIPI